MYFIILEPEGEGPINELVNDIVDAKSRGVQVNPVRELRPLTVCAYGSIIPPSVLIK